MRFGLLFCLLGGVAFAQPPYALHEIDLHLHSGAERPIPMDAWLDLAVKDGRKIVALIDHLELYRRTPEQYAAWREQRKHKEPPYPLGRAGQQAVMRDFDAARERRKDLILFKAWEISELELDTGLEELPMSEVDLIGWHISPSHATVPPDGKHLIRRAKQVVKVQKRFGVPMILLHPFPARLEHIQRKAIDAGRTREEITVEEYRFFQPGEQEELARILKGTSVYVEMSRATDRYIRDPHCRQALIEDIKPLADLGVRFTISTDAHGVGELNRTFRPAEQYCDLIGCNPGNSNQILEELLSRRKAQEAKKR